MNNNIFNYIEIKGNIPIANVPYNDVDYLILGMLSYVKLDELSLSYPFPLKTLEKDIETLKNGPDNAPIVLETIKMLEKMCNLERYKNIIVYQYASEIDLTHIKQFSATTYLLENEEFFISYRGTDETIVGWHEDFILLYEEHISSHQQALTFLEEINSIKYSKTLKETLCNKSLGTLKQRFTKHFELKKQGRPLLLGGHSKGGHLAMYAGVYINDNTKKNVKAIYNFDGPGFSKSIINTKEYQNMIPKIKTFVPQYSFFGIWLEHQEPITVITSTAMGLLQHDCFTWLVTGEGFVLGELSIESKTLSKKVNSFFDKLNYDERKELVATLFQIFYNLNIKTFLDLRSITLKQIAISIKEIIKLDSKVRNNLFYLLEMMWLEARKIDVVQKSVEYLKLN